MDNRERSELVLEALAHVVDRNPDGASQAMDKIGYNSDGFEMYAVCASIAEAARQFLPKIFPDQPIGSTYALEQLDPNKPTDPAKLFSLRFLVAHVNGDDDMTLALFKAAWTAGTDNFTSSVIELLLAVGEILRLALEIQRGES